MSCSCIFLTPELAGETEGNVSKVEGKGGDGIVKYMPSFDESDPVTAQALQL